MLIPQSSGRSKVRKEGKLIEFGVGLPLNISIDWNITKAVADLSFRIAKANWRTRSKLARTNLRSVLTSGEAPDVDASL
jgi:hypothetical protein